MKILVAIKRVLDPDQRVVLCPDGSRVDEAAMLAVMNPFDAVALEAAVGLSQARVAADGVEVVAVSVGPEDWEPELRTALAMGADRAVLVHGSAGLDPWNVARILGAVAEREWVDLVLMGKQAADDDAGVTGQFLAAQLDWPQATAASSLSLSGAGVEVRRETDAGAETLQLDLPAVVTADLRLSQPRYTSLPSLLRAREMPLEVIELATLGIQRQDRYQVLALAAESPRRNCHFLADTGELMVQLRGSSLSVRRSGA